MMFVLLDCMHACETDPSDWCDGKRAEDFFE
jgi:hypothetical protein